MKRVVNKTKRERKYAYAMGGYRRRDDIDDPILPELALWRACIKQSLDDLNPRRMTRWSRRERAISMLWFFGENATFDYICELAEMDPEYVRGIARIVCKMHYDRFSIPSLYDANISSIDKA